MMKSTAETNTLQAPEKKAPVILTEHIVEIVSDSGEGAQKAGQSFGSISAKMGNGVWTVEIIPADIQPPPRTKESASGIRIRLGSGKITNAGDEADLVVALNEIVPYARIEQDAYKPGTIMLIENKWATDESEEVRESYAKAIADFRRRGYVIYEIPMEEECRKLIADARKGKNMWVLGLLCYLYTRSIDKAEAQVKHTFRNKSQSVVNSNLELLHGGYRWARENLDFCYEIPAVETNEELVVMNGNEALSFGILASGIEVCSMYPITPATSTTHHLAECIEEAGGRVHQAEDEIAAIGFAIGAGYAGKTAVTITSGPGLALKTEFIGLAVMAEVPLVIIDVQRGGPSTGLPTKVEQSDLLAVLYGQPGDTPKIVIAPSTIEECFQFVILARKLAESFRMPVILLSDANLATGVQPFPRPQIREEWLAPPVDQSAWDNGRPYNWDERTGLSKRPVPGQAGGMYTLTGLAHSQEGRVTYLPGINQHASAMRSRKLAAFGRTLKPPVVHGDEEGGDLLLVGWGSTYGAITEAVDRARARGAGVSALHLRFLSPLEPGLKEIFSRFKKVRTVEINYSDDPSDPLITPENRRYAQLAWLLRAHTLVDIDCYSNVLGQPLRPNRILEMIYKELNF